MSMHRKKFISAAITTVVVSTILIPTADAQETIEGNVDRVKEINTDDLYKTIENEIQNNNIETITGKINNVLQNDVKDNNIYKTGLGDFIDPNNEQEENTYQESFDNKNDSDTINNNIAPETSSQHSIITEDKEDQKVDQHSWEISKNQQESQLQTTLVNQEEDIVIPQISYSYHAEEYIPEIKDDIKIHQNKVSENIHNTIEKNNNTISDVTKNFVLPTISLSTLPISLIHLNNKGTNSKNINVNSQINQLIALLEKNNVPVHDIIAKSPKEVRQAIAPYYTSPNAKPVAEKITYASKHVSAPQPKASTQSQKAVGFAHSRIGTPYVYGGTTDAGYDCSGFVQAAYRSAGVNIPRTTHEQANYGRSVSREELQPGDLVFYGNGGPSSSYHAAIYIGNGQVIHSPQAGDSVKKANIDMMRISAMTRPV